MTIKDLDDGDLRGVAERARRLGLSTQEYLRRLVAREARRPVVEDQMAALAARRRTGRQPMSLALIGPMVAEWVGAHRIASTLVDLVVAHPDLAGIDPDVATVLLPRTT